MASTPCCCARRPLGPPMGCRALLDTTTGDASIDRRAFPDASRHLRGLNPPTADHTGWANVSLGDDGDTPRSDIGSTAAPLILDMLTSSSKSRAISKHTSSPFADSSGRRPSGQRRADCGVGQTPASGRLQHWADSAKPSHRTKSLRPSPPSLHATPPILNAERC
jgi:hypothetical protein